MESYLKVENGLKQIVNWPRKYNLFGVGISATTYEKAVDLISLAAKEGNSAVITHLPVHGVVSASKDLSLRRKVNSFEIVAPDGHPVRWALNLFYDTKLVDRVYGPEFMLRLCRRAADEGIGIYLFGSYPHVLAKLVTNLIKKYPKLKIVGSESPPFRPLTFEEDKQIIDRFNRSGAGMIFLGLGCPLQDEFAYEHRNKVKAVQVCVGAAFDFHAGNKKMAPKWMQRKGLEWLYRLIQEPRRLWWRYLYYNSLFLYLLTKRLFRDC
jgi:N-acetylglucosaminyldiphosphoundecaprenol N-acetyl-beta-D-mannosaminyltransferase